MFIPEFLCMVYSNQTIVSHASGIFTITVWNNTVFPVIGDEWLWSVFPVYIINSLVEMVFYFSINFVKIVFCYLYVIVGHVQWLYSWLSRPRTTDFQIRGQFLHIYVCRILIKLVKRNLLVHFSRITYTTKVLGVTLNCRLKLNL